MRGGKFRIHCGGLHYRQDVDLAFKKSDNKGKQRGRWQKKRLFLKKILQERHGFSKRKLGMSSEEYLEGPVSGELIRWGWGSGGGR